jgi:putative acetyltransferase
LHKRTFANILAFDGFLGIRQGFNFCPIGIYLLNLSGVVIITSRTGIHEMKMREFRIMPAEADDYAGLVALWEASVRETHTFISENDIRFYASKMEDTYFPEVLLMIMKTTNEHHIVGFSGSIGNRIEMLFLHPDYMHQGYGRAFINYLVDYQNTCLVDVNEQNTNALAFYQKMGFEVIARVDEDAEGKPYPILKMMLSHPPVEE